MKEGLATSYRFSPETAEIIDRLAAALGVKKTAVIEMALHKLMREEFGENWKTAKRPKQPRGR
jgi:predicted transcriptional regulator